MYMQKLLLNMTSVNATSIQPLMVCGIIFQDVHFIITDFILTINIS